MVFNSNDYKNDPIFGGGAYESGLQSARNAAALKVQANFARQDAMKRLAAQQAAAKKAAADAQKASNKKTYNDALAYWNDPTNKKSLLQDGAYKSSQSILNDPAKQQQIKDAGFNQQDFIDAMYNASSDGKYHSAREYNQFASQLNKDTKASNKEADAQSMAQHGMNVQDYWDQVQKPALNAKQQQPQNSNGFLDKAKTVGLEALDLLGRPGNAVRTGIYDTLNGGNFLQGAKEGLLGQQHTSGVQLNQKLGIDLNRNPLTKNISNVVATALQNSNPLGQLMYNFSSKDSKDNIGQNSLGGATEALLDPLNLLGTGLVTKGIGKLGKLAKSGEEAAQSGRELLGLPAPQLRLNEPQLQLPGPKPITPSLDALNSVGKMPSGLKNPIPGMPKPMSEAFTKDRLIQQGLNFGQGSRFMPKARPDLTPIEHPGNPSSKGQAYWQGRYEDFVKHVQDSGYTSNNLSHDAIQELWTHFAKADEPVNIDQVVEMAYPKGFEAPPTPKVEAPKVEAPKQPTIKDYLNQDPRIKELAKGFHPPVRPEPKVSRLATLDEMVNNLKSMTPPKQAPIEPKPLQFAREKGFNPNLTSKIKNRGTVSNEVKPNNSLLMPLKPTILKSIKTAKSVHSMSKGELQDVYSQLEKQQSLLAAGGKGSAKKLTAVKEDMKKVNDLLMKLDLQTFGAKAPKELPIPKPKAGSTNISPAPKGSNADITDPNPADGHGHGLVDTQAVSSDMQKEIQKIKDISQLQVGTKNIYELADKLPKEMGDKIKSALDTAKKNHVNHLEQSTNDLYNKVVKSPKEGGLGIGKNTKESALVQDFGEKTLVKKYLNKRGIDPSKLSEQELNNINLQQLKKTHPNDWQKIVQADKYFRENYNNLIDQVNKVRKEIYPNNPDKIVPKRSDYYHHFNELTGMEGVKNLFDTPASIDPHLEGISPNTKPNSKFQGFMQKRMNGTYKSDAVGGYLKYLKASSHSIHVDPVIPVLRKTANQIADATEQTRNANKIVEALQDHAGDIAGKTNPYDRLLQKLTGRKLFGIINAANSRVKSNMVMGNLSSALGQVGNVPLGLAKAKLSSGPALVDTLAQAANHLLSKTKVVEKDLSAPIYKSEFLKERFHDQLFRRFDQKLIDQPKKMAGWLLETADKSGTNFIWNSMYRKGLSLAEKATKDGKTAIDPIKYADAETRSIVAGRGVGEVPLIQKAKTTQILAPFTLEVGNQWKVLSKMVGEKDAIGIMTFLAASYGLNKVMENVRGSGVSYDPIGAFQQGYNSQGGSTSQKLLHGGASVLGETVGNIPFGNLLTNQVNTQAKIPLTGVKIGDLFGDRNPNRFGTGLTVSKVVTDPLYLLPFGASQIEKTYKGGKAIKNEGVYNSNGKLQFPVNNSIPKDIQMLTMGPNATSEARNYYDNKGTPLSDKQTQQYQNAPNKQEYYNGLIFQRQVKSIQKKIKDTQKDTSLTPQERQQNILSLMQELQKLKK